VVAPLLTGRVGLHGVARGFDLLGAAGTRAKVLIDAQLSSSGEQPGNERA
jgi:hypothetical protein